MSEYILQCNNLTKKFYTASVFIVKKTMLHKIDHLDHFKCRSGV